MKNHLGILLVMLTVLSTCCNAVSDIYGAKLDLEPKLYNSYWYCQITEGARFISSTSWRRIGPDHPITNTMYGVAAIGQSKRQFPHGFEDILPLDFMQVLDLLKPLHVTPSLCCALECDVEPGAEVHLLGVGHWYTAKVECEHSKTKQKAVSHVQFLGDNPWCKCSINMAFNEYRRTKTFCDIPCFDDVEEWWCDQLNHALDNCNEKPRWVEIALKEQKNF